MNSVNIAARFKFWSEPCPKCLRGAPCVGYVAKGSALITEHECVMPSHGTFTVERTQAQVATAEPETAAQQRPTIRAPYVTCRDEVFGSGAYARAERETEAEDCADQAEARESFE